ncbi:hypothetical protein ACIQB5_51055 [Streptomyces sp. NPDC088560]|uniref:hypothetical protein n=1 Tax=Streptomyces sp. NPDC088560 TaxID=3365868 RepID=UPI003817ED54
MKWLVAGGAAVVAFGLALWLSYLLVAWPKDTAGRLVVDTAFALAVSAAVLASVGAWAGHGSDAEGGSPSDGDHINLSHGIFHGPVLGKGKQQVKYGRERK